MGLCTLFASAVPATFWRFLCSLERDDDLEEVLLRRGGRRGVAVTRVRKLQPSVAVSRDGLFVTNLTLLLLNLPKISIYSNLA